MITFNILSIPTFVQFLSWIFMLRRKYNETDSENRVPIMISYLRWPPFLSAKMAPREIKEKFVDEVKWYVREFAEPEPSKQLIRDGEVIKPMTGRFYLEEIDQVDRLCDFILTEDLTPEEITRNKKDFGLFIQEYDKRRDTDFRSVFPTLTEYYEECLSVQ